MTDFGGNMIIGNREESLEQKKERHIKETLEEKSGWENELEFAQKTGNSEYEEFCNMRIKIADFVLECLKTGKFKA